LLLLYTAQIADHLLRWISSLGDAGVLTCEALQTTAALVLRGLAPPPHAPELLLNTTCLSNPSRMSLAASAALFSRPGGSCAAALSDAEKDARHHGVGWALNSLVPLPLEQIAMSGPRRKEEPPDVRGVADVLRALCLGTPPHSEAADVAARWWDDDAFDDALRLLRRTVDAAGAAKPPDAAALSCASLQPPRLAAPLTAALLAHAGGMLTTALDGAREAAHIFALLAVAAELGRVAVAASLPDAPPEEWRATGAVAAAARRAVDRAQGVLSERCPPARLFTPRFLVAAQALGAAAAAADTPPLSGMLDGLSNTALMLRHTLYASADALRTAVTTHASTAIEDNLFFDGDEIMASATAVPSARLAAGTQLATGVGDAAAHGADAGGNVLDGAGAGAPGAGNGPLEICVRVIAALGELCPGAASEALIRLMCDSPEDALPPTVQDAVLDALCRMRGAPSSAVIAGMTALGAALSDVVHLDAEHAVWLLRLADGVARMLRSANAQEDAAMPDAEGGLNAQASQNAAYMQLCEWVCNEDVFPKLRLFGLSAGLALADAVSSLLCAYPEQPECVAPRAVQLLRDKRYAVRRAMAARFGEVLSNFPLNAHGFILADVRPILAGLGDTQSTPTLLSADEASEKARQETSLLLLGEVAASSSLLEAECVFDIINLAVEHPWHVTVALRVLSAVAKRLGYESRFGLIGQHGPYIAHKWVCSGRNVDSMLQAAELLAPIPELASGSGAENRLVQAYARYLLPRLVECNDTSSVARIASLCNVDARKLFQQHGARTMAALHCFRANTDSSAGPTAFRAAVSSSDALISLALGGSDGVRALYASKGGSILREMLLMVHPDADDGTRPTSLLPVLSVKQVLAGVDDLEKTMGASDPAAARAKLWAADKVASHLLDLHTVIDKAKSSRHRLVSLASLSALLQMLEARNLVSGQPSVRYYAPCGRTVPGTDCGGVLSRVRGRARAAGRSEHAAVCGAPAAEPRGHAAAAPRRRAAAEPAGGVRAGWRRRWHRGGCAGRRAVALGITAGGMRPGASGATAGCHAATAHAGGCGAGMAHAARRGAGPISGGRALRAAARSARGAQRNCATGGSPEQLLRASARPAYRAAPNRRQGAARSTARAGRPCRGAAPRRRLFVGRRHHGCGHRMAACSAV
jgi:hypothetical protein